MARSWQARQAGCGVQAAAAQAGEAWWAQLLRGAKPPAPLSRACPSAHAHCGMVNPCGSPADERASASRPVARPGCTIASCWCVAEPACWCLCYGQLGLQRRPVLRGACERVRGPGCWAEDLLPFSQQHSRSRGLLLQPAVCLRLADFAAFVGEKASRPILQLCRDLVLSARVANWASTHACSAPQPLLLEAETLHVRRHALAPVCSACSACATPPAITLHSLPGPASSLSSHRPALAIHPCMPLPARSVALGEECHLCRRLPRHGACVRPRRLVKGEAAQRRARLFLDRRLLRVAARPAAARPLACRDAGRGAASRGCGVA